LFDSYACVCHLEAQLIASVRIVDISLDCSRVNLVLIYSDRRRVVTELIQFGTICFKSSAFTSGQQHWVAKI